MLSSQIGEVMGSGAVAIFRIDDETILEPMDSGNYLIGGLKCDQLTKGWKYDVQNNQIVFIPPSAMQVDIARSWQLPSANIWLTGSENVSEQLGNNFPNFIMNNNSNFIAVISHPGYSAQLSQLLII